MVECKILSMTGAVLYWESHESLCAAVQECCQRGISLAAADLRGANLRGGYFARGTFTGAHFEGADLVGASFLNANLTNADFSGANVAEVTWTGTTVTGADLDATAVDATASTSAPASATSVANCIVKANSAGKIAAGFGGAASTLATLTAGSLVVENPANATATPTASKIVMSAADGTIAPGYRRGTVADSAAATPYAVPATADVVLGASTAGADQIANMPVGAAALVGHTIRITKQDANAHNVLPTPAGAETIDGVNAAGASSTVTVRYGYVDLQLVAVGVWQSMGRRLA